MARTTVPPPPVAFVAALHHLLAILVPIVTPGLLICQALDVSSRDTTLIVSMSLVISGIATYVQCKRFGPLGAGLLIVQGTSFNFVGPLIAGGSVMVKQGTPVETVMAAIFGVVIAGSFVEMGISRILPFVKRLITPLVTGIVVLLIGLTLIKVGLITGAPGLYTHPAVADAVRRAGAALSNAGYAVEEVTPPSIEAARDLWVALVAADIRELLWETIEANADPLGAKAVKLWRDALPPIGLRDYLKGFSQITRHRREWSLFLEQHPVLFVPIAAICLSRSASTPPTWIAPSTCWRVRR